MIREKSASGYAVYALPDSKKKILVKTQGNKVEMIVYEMLPNSVTELERVFCEDHDITTQLNLIYNS